MLCLNARAKINWTLDILGVRADGYHLMDMLMQSVALHDTLWFEPDDSLTLQSADAPAAAPVSSASTDGFSAPDVTYDRDNLVLRAAERLKAYANCASGARIRLAKRIPAGAGMGGGSADAAAALLGLNELWNLGLSEKELLALGLSIGADVPFQLAGGLARVGGIGESIVSLPPPPAIWLVLLQPCDGLSTREIFSAYDALSETVITRPQTAQAQRALLSGEVEALGKAMGNVLEGVSLHMRPAMAQALADMNRAGALRSMMTGSGSVIFGVFDGYAQASRARLFLSQKYGGCTLTRTESFGMTRDTLAFQT